MRAAEMSYRQRGIVESCFEESNYEQGISMLDQLRDPGVRPSPAHIRQLIYIALYPPPVDASSQSQKWKEKGKTKGKEADGFSFGIMSPNKLQQRNKQAKNEFVPPSLEAIERTWRLLYAYVLTYPPEVLLRAIPCYPWRNSEVSHIPRTFEIDVPWRLTLGEEDMDSGIAKVAAALKEHRDCWSLLRPGVVAAEDNITTSAVLTGDNDDDDLTSSMSVIGNHAWRLLEWLIQLFEKDQELVDLDHSDRFSICLLSQIKPPSSTHEPRSNVDTILGTVFACYEQTNQRFQDLGRRLMNLLIDLTSSPDFIPTQLITLTTARLLEGADDALTLFLRDLPPSPRGLAFKLAVCDRCISSQSALNGRMLADLRGAARPQARKARPLQAHAGCRPASGTMAGSTSEGSTSVRTGTSPWAIPNTSHIVELLESVSRGSKTSYTQLLVLYELLMTFSAFKMRVREETGEKDIDWRGALHDNRLRQLVFDIFSSSGLEETEGRKCSTLKDVLLSTLDIDKNRYD